MNTIIQTVASVPKVVRKALKLTGAPFRPAGTAILYPEHSAKPDIVVAWRRGADASGEVEAALQIAGWRRCRVYVAFESQALWDEWCRMQSPQH